MKKKTSIYLFVAIMFLSILSLDFSFKAKEVQADTVMYEPGTNAKTARYYYYSTNSSTSRARFYRGSTSADIKKYNQALKAQAPDAFYGDSRKLFREQYLGKYTWFTVRMPQAPVVVKELTDMSYMLENRQVSFGTTGDYLVTSGDRTYTDIPLSNISYRYNLKKGKIDKWGKYEGDNKGTKTILIGTFYNKNFEWRYLGYSVNGEPISNPYFPADYTPPASSQSEAGFASYWSKRNWYTNPWTHSLYQKVYLSSRKQDFVTESNMNTYFLREYPQFKQAGNAKYWFNRIVPLSDPALGATVWTGVHRNAGHDYYVVFTTEGPPQTNLRLWYFGIYPEDAVTGDNDYDNERAYAIRTRDLYLKTEAAEWTVKPEQSISSGEELRLMLSYFNQNTGTGVKVNAKDGPNPNKFVINLSGYYDSNVTGFGRPLDYDIKGLESYQDKTVMEPTEPIWFNIPYTVGKPYSGNATEPKKQIEFIPNIPNEFYDNGKNTLTEDDKLHIIMKISGENLRPEFVEYRDDSGSPISTVEVGKEYTAVYKLKKTNTGKAKLDVNDAKLYIDFYDGNKVVRQAFNTDSSDGVVYNSKGQAVSDDRLKESGDYTLHEMKITPTVNKMCSYAQIDNSLYSGMQPNPNQYLEDDKTDIICVENDLNIIVSNVKLVPDTIVLPNGTTSKYVNYSLYYKLTNHNLENKDLNVRMVYTRNGTQMNPSNGSLYEYLAPGTVEMRKSFGHNVSLGQEYMIQVEANPNTSSGRLIKESLSDGSDPYKDNIGWDILKIEQTKKVCPVNRQSNNWSQGFNVRHVYWSYSYDEDGYGYWESETVRDYVGPFSFYEKFTAPKVEIIVDGIGNREDKRYNLASGNAVVKAGQGFNIEVTTLYQNNANTHMTNIPLPYYSLYYDRYVDPDYSSQADFDTKHELYVMVKYDGQEYARDTELISESGTWYNKQRKFGLKENEGEKLIFVEEDTKDGVYSISIETTGFFGTPLKNYTPTDLCIKQTYQFEVKGSTNDDIHSHINNDFK